MDLIRIFLVRLVCPVRISSEAGDTESRLARNLTHILLAAPSTGGAVSLILRRSPCNPTIIFFEDRGWIKTLTTMPWE